MFVRSVCRATGSDDQHQKLTQLATYVWTYIGMFVRSACRATGSDDEYPKLTLTGFRVLGNFNRFYDFWYVTGNNCADMAPGLLLAGNEHC